MARKLNLIGLLIVIVAVISLGIFLFSNDGKSSAPIRVLSDGSLLQFRGYAYTNGMFTYRATPVTGWRAKVASKLPATWCDRLGWTTMGGGVMFGAGGLGMHIAAFTFCEMTTNTSFDGARVVVFDDLGNSFDGGTTRAIVSTVSGNTGQRVDGWVPPAFPRRGKIVGFRFFEQSNSLPVAEYLIPNPAVSNYPAWSPDPLPATKSDGDLSVNFTEFKAGLSREDTSRRATNNEFAVTQGEFRIMREGRPVKSWEPVFAEISDATGNHWMAYPYKALSTAERDADVKSFAFEGALWPGEAAWKLRVTFGQVSDFDTSNLCVISGIPVPNATELIALTNEAGVGGTQLHLVAITGPDAEQPGNFKWYARRHHQINLSLGVQHLPNDARVSIAAITDEAGHEVKGEGGAWNNAEQIFNFDAPAGAKQLNITFAVHRSHTVEFLVKPENVGGN